VDVTPIPKPGKKKKKKRSGFKGKALRWCQKCGRTDAPIGRHHIKKRSQGGPDTPENRIDLCEMFPDTCHRKADAYEEGYKPDDLRQAKAADEKRQRLYGDILQAEGDK